MFINRSEMNSKKQTYEMYRRIRHAGMDMLLCPRPRSSSE